MAVYRAETTETRFVKVEYVLEAADEDEVQDVIDTLRTDPDWAPNYIVNHPIDEDVVQVEGGHAGEFAVTNVAEM